MKLKTFNNVINKTLAVFGLVLLLSSCGEYQRVLKSTDIEYKFEKAVEYYEAGKYDKAYPLFDELNTLFRGTQKAKDVYFYYASTLYGMGDYILAGYHFKNFTETFPSNEKAEEAAFMTAYCYYLESPKSSLDQTFTYKAINEFQLFVNRYPTSKWLQESNDLMDDMRSKLEEKSFYIAKGYHRTQYYQAAVTAFTNSLNEFPDTPYREESMYLKLESAYELARNSITTKQLQRYKETLTAYYEFKQNYPQSKWTIEAERIFARTNDHIKELKSI